MAACHVLFCTLLVGVVIVNGQISGTMQPYQVHILHNNQIYNNEIHNNELLFNYLIIV